jgi:hypothetical protein
MNITPEHVGNLIFAISQTRYFEKDYKDWPSYDSLKIIEAYQRKIDEELKKMGVQEHISRQQLQEILKLVYGNQIVL